MATFLDISGLEHFSSFFVFLFVWLAVYALLQYTKVLGENQQAVNVIIGLIIGLFVLFSPIATGVIQYIAPWFAVILIFIVFINMSAKTMGTGTEIISGPTKAVVGVVVLLIVVVGALQYIRDEITLPGDNDTTRDYSKSSSVIFHPNMLGAIFILLVAVFTVGLLAAKQ